MFSLTMSFEDQFEFKDKVFHVDMSFDNIILLFSMFDDDEVMQHEKIFVALQLLIYEYDELELESFDELNELFKYVMKEFLEIDLGDKKDQENIVKVYDFEKDAELIFASFFAVYNLDLFELQGKLHWFKFNALLANLDDNSPFKKVIGYRTMKVPTEKEATKEYIQHVIKMKQTYSLEENGPKDVTNVFDQLSKVFKAKQKSK